MFFVAFKVFEYVMQADKLINLLGFPFCASIDGFKAYGSVTLADKRTFEPLSLVIRFFVALAHDDIVIEVCILLLHVLKGIQYGRGRKLRIH